MCCVYGRECNNIIVYCVFFILDKIWFDLFLLFKNDCNCSCKFCFLEKDEEDKMKNNLWVFSILVGVILI